tara:strand:+ start:1029 stop:1721 length:693 start_codon:yes stop_codon:yes gene_type:complete
MTLDHTIIRLSHNPEGFKDNVDDLTADMFESDLPIQHSHDYFADDETGLYVGVWDTTEMIEAAAPYAMDEFMVVIEGAAVIRNNTTNTSETILAGESFIIPREYDCQWQQTGYLRKFYVIADKSLTDENSNPTAKGIVKFPTKTDLGNNVYYKSANQQFVAGAFKGNIAESPITTISTRRFIYLKSGYLTLRDTHLTEYHFKAGDVFLLTGTQVFCRASEEISHHYVELS